MENEKELLEELDMLEPSKTIFITNYKLLKKEKRKLEKLHKDSIDLINNSKDEDERDYYEKNKLFLLLSINKINKSLKVAESIIKDGITVDKIIVFYLSLYHLYEVCEFL